MKKIKKTGDKITVQVVYPVYKTQTLPLKDSRGRRIKDDLGKYLKEERTVFVKYVNIPMSFSVDGITFHGGTLTTKGTVSKTQCTIFDRNTGQYYKVNHSQNAILEALSCNQYTPIGFLGHLQSAHKDDIHNLKHHKCLKNQ